MAFSAKLFLTILLWVVPALLLVDIIFGVVQWHDLALFKSNCSKFGTPSLSNHSSSTTSFSLQISNPHSNKSQEHCVYLYHLNQIKQSYSHFHKIPSHLKSHPKIFYSALKHHVQNSNSTLSTWQPSKQSSTLQSLFWSAAQLNPDLIQEHQLLQVIQHLDPAQVQQFIQQHPCHTCSLPSNWHCNQTIAEIALTHCPLSVYPCLCEQIQTDSNLLLPIVEQNSAMVTMLHSKLLQQQSFLKQLINKNPHFVKYASEELRSSFIQMLPLIRRDGHVIQYATEPLKNNQVMLLEAIKQSASVLQYVPDSIKSNFEFMHKAILLNVWAAAWVSPTMQDSNTLVFEAIRIHPSVLEVVDASFRKDATLVKFAALKNPQSLIHADQELLNDRMFAQELLNLGCRKCLNHFSKNINESEEEPKIFGQIPAQIHSQL